MKRASEALIISAVLAAAALVSCQAVPARVASTWSEPAGQEFRTVGRALVQARAKECGCYSVKRIAGGTADYLVRCDANCGAQPPAFSYYTVKTGQAAAGPYAVEQYAASTIQ